MQAAGEFDVAVDAGFAPIRVWILAGLLCFRLNI